MKFGHYFQEHLENDGFPPHWVESAISYRQLKKCIKRLEKELVALGLDAATLTLLLQTVEEKNNASKEARAGQERSFEYLLSDPQEPCDGSPPLQTEPFHPILLFAVDEETGEPLDARLAPSTRDYLHKLAVEHQLTSVRVAELPDNDPERAASITDSSDTSTLDDRLRVTERRPSRPRRMIEIPLTSDSEFFDTLQRELSGLSTLQNEEQQKLNTEVVQLGRAVTKVTEPTRASAKHDMVAWREIFQLYIESCIFFSTREIDYGAHGFEKARALFQKYTETLQQRRYGPRFKRRESIEALERFLQINAALLQTLRFQEINQIAMRKILKKFDKHTALGIGTSFQSSLRSPFLSQSVAKAVCYQVSVELLPVVPQLEDYLCPVCFSISYRPVRLRCQHVFCIRCLVVMQRENSGHCPLCRGAVVMEADSTNIDPALANFLIKYFPDEVKVKQKENEIAAGIDQYGEAFNDKPCIVM